jgi:CheY-like chemotaxis protein
VDDNPSIQKIVVSLLAPAAMEVSYAASAIEAFGFIAKGAPFDAALIDTSLPEMDGWELLKRLRGDPKTANLPIAMMAGILEDVDPGQVENASIQLFLRKPVDLQSLVDKVYALLSIPAAPKAAAAPLAEPAPPDLLLLEEQDLAEDIAFTPDGVVTRELSPLGQTDDSGDNADTSEEVFSLELEELDLNAVGDFAISAPEFDAQGGDLSDVIEDVVEDVVDLAQQPSQDGGGAQDDIFSGSTEIEARPAAAMGAAQGSGLLDILESNAQQPLEPHENDGGAQDDIFSGTIELEARPAGNRSPNEGSDLLEMPNIISRNLLDTSPGDFGPDILLDENLDGLSSLGTELLSNPKFINAVAKAVAKNLDRLGQKY